MADIKTRNIVKGTIKTIDKSVVATEKTKDNIVNVKNKSESATNPEERNANEYATNKITNAGKVIVDNSGKIKKKGNDSVRTTKENFVKAKQKVRTIKTRLSEKKKIKHTTKGIKASSKVAKKEAQKVAKETVKASQRAMKLANII